MKAVNGLYPDITVLMAYAYLGGMSQRQDELHEIGDFRFAQLVRTAVLPLSEQLLDRRIATAVHVRRSPPDFH